MDADWKHQELWKVATVGDGFVDIPKLQNAQAATVWGTQPFFSSIYSMAWKETLPLRLGHEAPNFELLSRVRHLISKNLFPETKTIDKFNTRI